MSKRKPVLELSLATVTGVGLVLIMASGAWAGKPTVDCQWNAGMVSIDGAETEWPDKRTYLEDIKGGVGAMNDSEYAYIHLATIHDDLAHQILGRGMVVWFDPDGGDKKVIGIRFPLGTKGQGLRNPGETNRRPSPDELAGLIDTLPQELEILNTDGEVLRRFRADLRPDIEAKVSYHSGRLVYELKIPLYLNAEHPFAIGAIVGTEIGIGFETPEFAFDRPKMESRGGGRGGRGGGGKGGRGGMKGGSRPERPEPLKLWTKAQLAVATDTDGDN